MQVAIYARYSTDFQKDTSIEDQVRRCKQYIGSKGIEASNIKVYSDRAVSGAVGSSGRAQYAELLNDIKARNIDLLVLDEQSRLTRSELEFLEVRKLLELTGVRLLTADGVDSQDPSFNLISSIQSAINAKAREETTFRVLRGMEGVASRGGIFRTMPYGYRRSVTLQGDEAVARWEVDEEQAKHVRTIFELRAKGHTYRDIAKHLNTQGILAPRGGPWQLTGISRVLSNPVYTGRITFGDGDATKYRKLSELKVAGVHTPGEVLPDLKPLIDIYDPNLAIISEELYSQVAPSSFVGSKTGRGGGAHWSNGLIQHRCGRYMSARNSNTKTVSLHCSRCVSDRYHGLDDSNLSGNYLNQLTMQYFLTSVLELLFTADRVEAFKAQLRAKLSSPEDSALKDLEARLKSLGDSEARIVEAIAYVGEGDVGVLYSRLKEIVTDKEKVSREISRLKAGKGSLTSSDIEKQLSVNPLDLIPYMFQNAPACELRSFLSKIFPLIEFEGRSPDNKKYAYFRVRFAPGVLASLTSGTPVILTEEEEYRFEVVSSSRRVSPPAVTLLDAQGNPLASTKEFKYCPKCRDHKPIEDFSYSNKKAGTRSGHCKTCVNKAYRERKKKK